MKKNSLLKYSLCRLLFIAFLLIVSCFKTMASDYYWIGNSGNWSDLTHWVTTSAGTTLQTQLPTVDDDVFFDANSFSLPGQIVNINVGNALTHAMNWTGVINNPTLNGASTNFLKIYGSLVLVAGMNLNFSGPIQFIATTPGQALTSAGKIFQGYVAFSGVGGEWTLQDDFASADGFSLGAGTFNSNDKTITSAGFYFGSSLSATFNMGASVINLTGISAWTISSANLTINAGTSIINCTADSARFEPIYTTAINTYYDVNFTSPVAGFIFGPANFHDVDFAGRGYINSPCNFHDVNFHAGGYIVSDNVFNDLNFTAGGSYTVAGVQTINGTFNATGTCESLITMGSAPSGVGFIKQASGAVNIAYVQMRSIHTMGAASFIADNCIDLSNNTGWTFSYSSNQDMYWIGNGGIWRDPNHWSYSSGGPPAGCVPYGWNNVFFDANSFSLSGQTVSIDTIAYCRDMNWTGVTSTPSFIVPAQFNFNLFGSIALSPAMNVSFPGIINFSASTPGHTITSEGKFFGRVHFANAGGTWTLQDTFNCDSSISLFSGTLNTNNQQVNAHQLSSPTLTQFRKLDLGSSVINLSGIVAWSIVGTGFRIDAGTSVINCTRDTGIFSISYFGGGAPVTQIYNDVNFTGDKLGVLGGTDHFHNVYFEGNGNCGGSSIHKAIFQKDGLINQSVVFDSLFFSAGSNYLVKAGSTQTINNLWKVQGTCTDSISIQTSVAGTFATFNKTTDSVRGNYLNIKDIHCTGGAAFKAYNSIDEGGNAGWNFINLPPLGNPGSISGPATVCPGASGITFYVSPVQGAIYYEWTVPAGASITSGQGDTLIVVDFGSATSGDITVYASEGCNFSSSGSNLSISFFPEPAPLVTLDQSPVTANCPGTLITFTATATNTGNGTITYNFKLNGASVQDGNANTYNTAALANGDEITCAITVSSSACFAPVIVLSNSIIINVLPQLTPAVTFVANPGATVCPLTEVTFTAIAANAGSGTVNYDFMVNGTSVQNGNSDTYVSTVLNNDIISCVINVSGSACYTSTTATSNAISIIIDPASGNVQANAGTDATIATGQTLQLNAYGDTGTYLWSPASGLSAVNILNPVASPAVTTTYTLTITDLFGCLASDNVKIEVKDLPIADCLTESMNAFTPNGDGINDTWITTKGNCISNTSVIVFNRYGTTVFQSLHYQNDWQGTYKGKPLPDGTYYSIITYTLNDGRQIIKRNDLAILR